MIVNNDDNDVVVENDDNEDEEDEVNILKQWTSHHLKIEGLVDCAGHQIQLVVNDGFKEQKSYHQVQAVFAKAKSISALSHKSSHFIYSLSLKIPVPNNACWNLHVQLHEHLLKHFECKYKLQYIDVVKRIS